MALETPALKDIDVSPLSSRYVRTKEIPWTPMAEAPGIDFKVLVQDTETGLFTGLFRLAPGAVVPDHIHTALEHSSHAMFVAVGAGIPHGRSTGSPDLRGVPRVLADLLGIAVDWPDTGVATFGGPLAHLDATSEPARSLR